MFNKKGRAIPGTYGDVPHQKIVHDLQVLNSALSVSIKRLHARGSQIVLPRVVKNIIADI